MKFNIELTKEEMEALAQLLDLALRSQGMGILQQINHFVAKLEQAKPVTEEEENGS